MRSILAKIKDYGRLKSNVKVDVLRGDKKIRSFSKHNSGTIDLCRFIRDSLTGDISASNMPGIIVPCKTVNKELVDITASGVPFISVSKTDSSSNGSNYAAADFKFIIPHTILTNETITGFRLYSLDKDRKLFAEVKFDGDSIKVDSTMNIEVIWRLHVTCIDIGTN